MAETLSPAYGQYDAKTDLEAMRDMRQLLANRLKSPALYGAPNATTVTQILTVPGQFPEFKDYPKNLPPSLDQIMTIANSPDDPRQTAYAQHVKNAITAATESITPPVAKLPDATGWLKAPRNGVPEIPGPNFYWLGDVGGIYSSAHLLIRRILQNRGSTPKISNI